MKSIIDIMKDEFNSRPLNTEEVLKVKKMDQLDDYFEKSLDSFQRESYYTLEEVRTDVISMEVNRALEIGFMFGLQVCNFVQDKDNIANI